MSAAPLEAVVQEGVLLKVVANPQSYCHMKFLAIREDTLASSNPVLKDAGSRDIIDFYGPCSHDPLEKKEVQAQRQQNYSRIGRDQE